MTTTLCIFSFVVYNFSFWISNTNCSHNLKYTGLTQALVYIDTLLTLVIPFIFITILMTAMVYNLVNAYQRQQRLNREPKSKDKSKPDDLPAAKVTKMLFIVSLLYFVVNIPSHVIRLEILVNNFIKGRTQISNVERAMQTIFQLLYYLSFAVNIIIYFKFGRNFRTTFRKSFCKFQRFRTDNTDSTEAINMVPRTQTRVRRSMTDYWFETHLLLDTTRHRCVNAVN